VGDGSEVIELEVSKIPDPDKRTKVEMLYSIAKMRVQINDDIKRRAWSFAYSVC